MFELFLVFLPQVCLLVLENCRKILIVEGFLKDLRDIFGRWPRAELEKTRGG